MSTETENLVVEILRRIQSDLASVKLDMVDIKHRMSSIELHIGELSSSFAGQSLRIDRLDERLARIERRLELQDTEK